MVALGWRDGPRLVIVLITEVSLEAVGVLALGEASAHQTIGSDVNASRNWSTRAWRASVRPIRRNLAQPSVSIVMTKQGT
jgi:hypothetical protein